MLSLLTRVLEYLSENPMVAILLVFMVFQFAQKYFAGPFPEAGGRVSSIESLEAWEAVLKKDLVVADFYATWCPPCRTAAPIYGQLSLQYDAAFVKVDVDKNRPIASKEGISAMPTFKLYKKGQCVNTIQGFNQQALTAALTEVGAPLATSSSETAAPPPSTTAEKDE